MYVRGGQGRSTGPSQERHGCDGPMGHCGVGRWRRPRSRRDIAEMRAEMAPRCAPPMRRPHPDFCSSYASRRMGMTTLYRSEAARPVQAPHAQCIHTPLPLHAPPAHPQVERCRAALRRRVACAQRGLARWRTTQSTVITAVTSATIDHRRTLIVIRGSTSYRPYHGSTAAIFCIDRMQLAYG